MDEVKSTERIKQDRKLIKTLMEIDRKPRIKTQMENKNAGKTGKIKL